MLQNRIDKELLSNYLSLGWVIRPNGKTPDGKYKKPLGSWKEYNTDKDIEKPTLEELWRDLTITYRGQVFGIGAVTGKHSGFIVLDLDTYKEEANFKELKAELVKLKTPVARTGGGGFHVYFKYTDDVKNSVDKLSGVDTRGQGGYVVLPPSPHHSGTYYEWIHSPFDTKLIEIPENILNLLPKKKNTDLVLPNTFQTFDYTKNYYQGERDQTMFSVARSLIKLLPLNRAYTTALPLFMAWAKVHIVDNQDGFINDLNLKAKFEHALKYETEGGEVITNISDLTMDETKLENLFRKERFGISTKYPKFDEGTGGILSSSLTLISAQTGVGKSLVFMNFLDRIEPNRRIAYFDLENGTDETIERILRIRHGLKKNFFEDISNLPKVKQMLNNFTNYSYFSTESGIRNTNTLFNKLKEMVDKGVEVFVIDPLQKIEGGDDLKLQGRIVGQLSDFAKTNKVAVLLCHHVKKSVNSGGRYVGGVEETKEVKYLDPDIEDVKGGSIITDTAENVWLLMRNNRADNLIDKSKMLLRVSKCRTNGEALGDYRFYLDLKTLQMYENINQISSYFETGSMYNA
jgi:archaellum biogenesis ATPase FlaH